MKLAAIVGVLLASSKLPIAAHLFSLMIIGIASSSDSRTTETIIVFKPGAAEMMIANGRKDPAKVFFEVPVENVRYPIYTDGQYAIGFAFTLPLPAEVPLPDGEEAILRGAVNWGKPRSGLTSPEIDKIEKWPRFIRMQGELEVRDNGKDEVELRQTAYFLPNSDPLASGAIVCKRADDHCQMRLRTSGFYSLFVGLSRNQIDYWSLFAHAAQDFVARTYRGSEPLTVAPGSSPGIAP